MNQDVSTVIEDELSRQVRELVGEMSPAGPRTAKSTDRLIEDLGYDSMALIELAFAMVSTFALRPIKEDAAIAIQTVAEVEALVRSLGDVDR